LLIKVKKFDIHPPTHPYLGLLSTYDIRYGCDTLGFLGNT